MKTPKKKGCYKQSGVNNGNVFEVEICSMFLSTSLPKF